MAATYALYIAKEESYFGAVRPFGNTYHFNVPDGTILSGSQASGVVANAEKLITSSEVDFKSWKVWGPTNGPAFANIIQSSGDLTGSGSGVPNTNVYREACYLIVWELGRSPTTNRRRWLRKFIRVPGGTSAALLPGVAAGVSPLTTTQQNEILTAYANKITALVTTPGTLSTDKGSEPVGAPQVRPYLYTRQIGS